MIETHKIVMSGNLLWAGMAAPVFLIFFVILWKRVRAGECGPTERLMAGIALVGFASMIHRAYWAAWRYFLDTGQYEIAKEFVTHGWLLTGLVAAIALGYALHLKPYLEGWLGVRWAAVVGLYAAGLCTIPFPDIGDTPCASF